MTRELEVKVLKIDTAAMEQRIVDLGGQLISREKQINTLIDSSDNPIKAHLDAYLRIRETKDLLSGEENIILTLKKNIANEEVRENIELNVGISDRDAMLHVFENLGFDLTTVGYKDRTSYSLLGARIDIDIWDTDTYPYPYMEIEVEREDELKNLLELLDILPENVSRLSIVDLQKQLEEGINA